MIAPKIAKAYRDELLLIGGLNRLGDPNLIFEFGGTATRWFRGKRRIHYRDMGIPARKHTSYVRSKGKSSKEYPTLEKALESEWGVLSVKIRYEFTGKPLWYISRWHPPEEKGSPEEWERSRWKEAHDPEMGYIPRCDMLGAFPTRGFYEPMLFAGEHRGEHLNSGAPVFYYRPIDDDVMNDVRKAWHEREHAAKFNATQFIRDWYAKEKEVTDIATTEEHYRRMDTAKTAYYMHSKERVFNSKGQK